MKFFDITAVKASVERFQKQKGQLVQRVNGFDDPALDSAFRAIKARWQGRRIAR